MFRMSNDEMIDGNLLMLAAAYSSLHVNLHVIQISGATFDTFLPHMKFDLYHSQIAMPPKGNAISDIHKGRRTTQFEELSLKNN